MASTPDAQPDHHLVRSLDPDFTGEGGNAAALAGWLEYLAHPEQHEGPRWLVFEDGTELESVNNEVYVGMDWEERPILRDLSLDRFFAHADVFTGQQTGRLTDDKELTKDSRIGAARVAGPVRWRTSHAPNTTSWSCGTPSTAMTAYCT